MIDGTLILLILAVKLVFAFPVAWLFERKGYGYGRFFLIGLLLDPFSCFALYLLMPRIGQKRDPARFWKEVG